MPDAGPEPRGKKSRDAPPVQVAGSVDMIKWLFGFVAAANIAIFVRLAIQP